jgi:hypothetical protein
MEEWTAAGTGARLMMMVLHHDPVREYAYGPAALDASAAPHLRQKLASTGFTVLQEEQRFSTLAPHFMQNSASAGLS